MNIFLETPDMIHHSGKGLGQNYSDINKWVITRDYFEFVQIVDKYFDDDLSSYKMVRNLLVRQQLTI